MPIFSRGFGAAFSRHDKPSWGSLLSWCVVEFWLLMVLLLTAGSVYVKCAAFVAISIHAFSSYPRRYVIDRVDVNGKLRLAEFDGEEFVIDRRSRCGSTWIDLKLRASNGQVVRLPLLASDVAPQHWRALQIAIRQKNHLVEVSI